MENILMNFVILVGIIVITSILNEKKLHIQGDIALVIVSFGISLIILLIQKVGIFSIDDSILMMVKNIGVDKFLLECALCFMLFASASKVHINKFVKNVFPIFSLAIITTVVTTLFYSFVFYFVALLFNIDFDIWLCLLLGAVIAPTDPLSVTGILNKLGMSKSVLSVIEGESLFNDGVAIAIFIFTKGVIVNSVSENVLLIFLKEILGAAFIGFVVSFLLFELIKMTNEPIMHILISLLTVSLSYVLCEELEFSGVIASVICGMYFSYQTNKIERWKAVVDSKNLYKDFWGVIENLLNSVLFVLVGFSILSVEVTEQVLALIPIAIILNILARFVGVLVSSLLIGKKNIPGKYTLREFVTILTCGGLKGGLSLALALTLKGVIQSEPYMVIINVVLSTILFTTIVQGSIVGKVYKNIEEKRDKCTALVKK